jgi:hypothetical protein
MRPDDRAAGAGRRILGRYGSCWAMWRRQSAARSALLWSHPPYLGIFDGLPAAMQRRIWLSIAALRESVTRLLSQGWG